MSVELLQKPDFDFDSPVTVVEDRGPAYGPVKFEDLSLDEKLPYLSVEEVVALTPDFNEHLHNQKARFLAQRAMNDDCGGPY